MSFCQKLWKKVVVFMPLCCFEIFSIGHTKNWANKVFWNCLFFWFIEFYRSNDIRSFNDWNTLDKSQLQNRPMRKWCRRMVVQIWWITSNVDRLFPIHEPQCCFAEFHLQRMNEIPLHFANCSAKCGESPLRKESSLKTPTTNQSSSYLVILVG